MFESLDERRNGHAKGTTKRAQFQYVQPSLAALTLADEGLRLAEAGREHLLSQAAFFADGLELTEKDGVLSRRDALVHDLAGSIKGEKGIGQNRLLGVGRTTTFEERVLMRILRSLLQRCGDASTADQPDRRQRRPGRLLGPVPLSVLAGLMLCFGCGTNKHDAIAYSKKLLEAAPHFDRIAGREAEVIDALRRWAEHEVFAGGGSYMGFGDPYVSQKQRDAAAAAHQYETQVSELIGSIAAVSIPLLGQDIGNSEVQAVRETVKQRLEGRSKLYEDLKPILSQYAREVLNPQLRFDQHPECIERLTARLRGFVVPPNPATAAAAELRVKFKLSDSELTR